MEPAKPSALRPDTLGARFISAVPLRPTLFVVVDTEEEFDWSAPFSRARTSVRAMASIAGGQKIFDAFGVRPTYVVDYPVATQPDGYRPLQEITTDGRCTVGAHLHPWVNPPFVEAVNAFNSYACNLDGDVERRKIAALRDAIGERLSRPTIYKAGRYGFSASTAATLAALEFEVDMSVNPTLRPSTDGGPSFDAFDSRPFVCSGSGLLEIPCTHEYIGWAGALMKPLHRTASLPLLEPLRAPGVLARMRAVNRVMLSPEGSTLEEMKRLTRGLLERGVRVLSLTFHSPSLDAGHTPYVRTAADLSRFLDRIRGYCDFFFGEIGGVSSTPCEFRDAISASEERAA